MRRTLVSSLVAFLAVGCTWVSQKDYEDQRDQLDEDRDGTPYRLDCDDQDPSRGDQDEIPYDAVDNDCSLGKDATIDPSDVDVDGDDYPAISQEDYEALAAGLKTPLEYPAIFVGRPLDCDDADPEVNPGKSPNEDTPYDGIDTNCDGANDFDRDGDGYFAAATEFGVPVTDRDVQAYVDAYGFDAAHVDAWGPGGSGGPRPGDCEDNTELFFPSDQIADLPYSGIDEDCDGTDDFDQDGDGHLPPGYASAWRIFENRYFRESPDKPDDDCADGPAVPDVAVGVPYAPLLDLATAAAVFPGATDLWYDGIDSDCDGADDFDQDVDGFHETDRSSERADFIATWGYEDQPWADGLDGDCDDTLDTFRPGVLDTLWTGADEDCDGLDDLSFLNFGSGGGVVSTEACATTNGGFGRLCWSGASNPELLWFNDSDFALFAAAMRFTEAAGGAVLEDEQRAGVLIQFEQGEAIGAAAPSRIDGRSWLRSFQPTSPQVLSPYIDLAQDTVRDARCTTNPAAGNDCSWITVAGNGENDGGELNGALVYALSDLLAAIPQGRGYVSGTITAVHVDAANFDTDVTPSLDVGAFVQCGPERLHGKLSSNVNSFQSDLFGGDLCFFYGPPPIDTGLPLVEVCDDGVCTVVAFANGQTFEEVPEIDVSTHDWIWGEREANHTLLVNGASEAWVVEDALESGPPPFEGLVFTASADAGLPAETIAEFDLDEEGGDYFLAGLTTDGRVLLERLEGLFDDEPERIELQAVDPSNPTYVPVAVSVAVGPDQVGVAVTFEDVTAPLPRPSSIGWTFLGRP